MHRVKLTDELIAAIAERLTVGVPLAVVARGMGLSDSTVQEWVERGQGRHPDRKPTPMTTRFALAVDEARAKHITHLCALAAKCERGGDTYTEEHIEYAPGPPTADGVPTQVVKSRKLITKVAERDSAMIRWRLEKADRVHFGRVAELELSGSVGFVIEAPAPEDDIAKWREKYTPSAAQAAALPEIGGAKGLNGNGSGNGANGNGHAGSSSGNGSNGHG